MSLFNISIITAAASSIGTDGYKLTALKEVCISLGDLFRSFDSSANEEEFKTLCFFLLKLGCIISTKYLNEELNFLVHIFVENVHGRNYLNSITKSKT